MQSNQYCSVREDHALLHAMLHTRARSDQLFPPLAALRLNGVDSKAHPVFRELTRVKQYFEKIHEAENGGPKKRENLTLDKAAASRFIKHALVRHSISTHLYIRAVPADLFSLGWQSQVRPSAGGETSQGESQCSTSIGTS